MFYFSISSSSTEKEAQNFDLNSIVLFSDKINNQPRKNENQTNQAKDFIRRNNTENNKEKNISLSPEETMGKLFLLLAAQVY